MQYTRVCLESAACVLPDEVVTTAEIERRLEPLYSRLRLPEGRLELISGIRERRFFPPGTRPSDVSIQAVDRALAAAGVDRGDVGALVHGSVCRDFLEPATACRVHHATGLPADCAVFDVSNACLGVLTGAVQVANMIELGQVRAGVVVGTECGRELVENTIRRLNADTDATRDSIKPSIASLTIGSASAALVLCDVSLSRTGNLIHTVATRAATQGHALCQSAGLAHDMATDSELLLRAGVEAGAETFAALLAETGWRAGGVDRSICHQVGGAHRRAMLERLGLSPDNDYSTFETLGNTGSAALPATLALAAEAAWLRPGDRVGLLGIGSGVNCLMMGVDWQTSLKPAPPRPLAGPQRAAV